tara:strand:- start:2294 stop:2509 length:216 start_codon:yes stop_codon:yes gene_type:complete
MSIETGGPAFPHPAGWRRDPEVSDGMTLRDFFAAAALTGSLANPNSEKRYSHVAELAWRYADAMLTVRGQE